MSYLKRHLAHSVQESLDSFPCVFINGPRQSGKTTLARMVWSKADYVNLDDAVTLSVASASPLSFLSGYHDKLILDEIQLVPELHRALKVSIDTLRHESHGKLAGRYILTGSTNILALPTLSDALVGRMVIQTLYPLSVPEVYGNQANFIQRLSEGAFKAGTVPKYDLLDALQKATFPEVRKVKPRLRAEWMRSYLSTLIQRDVQHIMDIEKTTLLPQLLRLMASRVGGMLNEADLARSVKENAVTTKRYRTILDLLFLTLPLPPWYRNVSKRLVKSPKIYLIDTNMLCTLLGREIEDIAKHDLNLFGHVLENFVATELLKQLSKPLHQAGLHHFRTGEGKEVDFVIESPEGKILGIEVKASETITNRELDGLIELQNIAGKDFSQGCILYTGRQVLKMADKLWALPMSTLWE